MQMFRLDGHEIKLLDQLQRQQRDLKFCDTLLQTDGISVPAHSCVLAALSPYLTERLSATAPPPFGHKRQLQIQSIRASTLLKLVGLLYSGKIEVIGSTEKSDVLAAASQFGLTILKEDNSNPRGEKWENYVHCEKYCVNTPSPSHCDEGKRTRDAEVQVGNTCHQCGTHSLLKKRSFGTQTTAVDEDAPFIHQTLNSVCSTARSVSAQNKKATSDQHLVKHNSRNESTSTSEPLAPTLSLNASYNSSSPHRRQRQSAECVQGEEARKQNLSSKTTVNTLQTSSEVEMGSSVVKLLPNVKVGRKNLTRMKQMDTRRFSFKVKLRRKTRGGVWEVVSLHNLDGISALNSEPQDSSKPRSPQIEPDVWFSPTSDENDPSAAAEDQLQDSAETEEQIEKLLEDIMMGLDILPNLESDSKRSSCLQQNHGEFTCSDQIRGRDATHYNHDSLTESCSAGEKAQSEPNKPQDESLQQPSLSNGQCPKSANTKDASHCEHEGRNPYSPGFQELYSQEDHYKHLDFANKDCFTLLPLPKLQHLPCLSPIHSLSPEAEPPPQDLPQPWFQHQPSSEDPSCVAAHSGLGHESDGCSELPKSVTSSRKSTSASQTGATSRPIKPKRGGATDNKVVKRKRKDTTNQNTWSHKMGSNKDKTALEYGGKSNQTTAVNEQDVREYETDRSKVRTCPLLEGKQSTRTPGKVIRMKGKVQLKQRCYTAPTSAADSTPAVSERSCKDASRRVEIDDCNIIALGEREATKQIVTRNKYQKFIKGEKKTEGRCKNSDCVNVVDVDESQKRSHELDGGVTEECTHIPQDENQNDIIHVIDVYGPQRRNPTSPSACCLDNSEELPGQDLPSQTLPLSKHQDASKVELLKSSTMGSTSASDTRLFSVNPGGPFEGENMNCMSSDLLPQEENEESDVDVVCQSPDQEPSVPGCVKINLPDISHTDEEDEEVNVTGDDSQ